MGWLDHDRLGFNYRLSDIAAALGVAQVERLDAMLDRRAAVAALYEEGLAAIEGVATPIAARGAERRSWFVYPVRLADGTDRDAVVERLAERGVASKAYLPCIHLIPHLRELGYAEGQFPVAEATSAHSLALPFFPAMAEAQVTRVCEASPNPSTDVALPQRPRSALLAPQPLARLGLGLGVRPRPVAAPARGAAAGRRPR